MRDTKLGNIFKKFFSASSKNGYPSEVLTIVKGLMMILFFDVISNGIRYFYLHKSDDKKYFYFGIELTGIIATAAPSTIAFCLIRRLNGIKKKAVCIGTILFIIVGFYELPLLMGAEIEVIYIKYTLY